MEYLAIETNINDNIFTSIDAFLKFIESKIKVFNNIKESLEVSNYCFTDLDFIKNKISAKILVEIPQVKNSKFADQNEIKAQISKLESFLTQLNGKRYYLPKYYCKKPINPLDNLDNKTLAKPIIEDFNSIEFPISKFISLKDKEAKDRLSVVFNIDKNNSYLLDSNVRTGTNPIPENNTVILCITLDFILKSSNELTTFVTNTDIVSQVIYAQFLADQLKAFKGIINNKPYNKQNIVSTENNIFDDAVKDYSDKIIITYPDGELFYIPKNQLSYQEYTQTINSLYDKDSATINWNQQDKIKTLENKVINFDYLTKTLVYTDNNARITSYNLEACKIINNINNYTVKEPKGLKLFLEIAKRQLELEEINYAYIYSNINELNIDVILKCRFIPYLISRIENKINKIDDLLTLKEDILERDSAYNTNKLPKGYIEYIKDSASVSNKILDFPLCFRDDFFLYQIGLLVSNQLINRAVILSDNVNILFNKLSLFSKVNCFILNTDTLIDLYNRFNNNIFSYINSIPKEAIILIDTEVLAISKFLGDTNSLLGNVLRFRYLILEFLNRINYDYIVYYDNLSLNNNLYLVIQSLLNNSAKYRYVYSSNKNLVTILNGFEFVDFNRALLPNFNEFNIIVNVNENKLAYYKDLVTRAYGNLLNDSNYLDIINLDKLKIRTRIINNLLSKYFDYANNFLNHSESATYIYANKIKDKRELETDKFTELYQIIYSHFNGGLINGAKYSKKENELLIICTLQSIKKYLVDKINKLNIPNKDKIYIKTYNEFLSSNSESYNLNTIILYNNSFDTKYLVEVNNKIESIILNSETLINTVTLFNLLYKDTFEINNYNAALNYYIRNKEFYEDNLYTKDLSFDLVVDTVIYSKYLEYKANEFNDNLIQDYVDYVCERDFINYSIEAIFNNFYIKPHYELVTLNSYFYPYINSLIIKNSDYYLTPVFYFEQYNYAGNKVYFSWYNNPIDIPISTEYGSGYLKSNTRNNSIVDLINFGDITINKDLVFSSDSINFSNYVTMIANYGDVKIDEKFLKDDSDDGNLTKPNEIVLNLEYLNIDGYDSIISEKATKEASNLLEEYNFNNFKNIYLFKVDSIELYNDIANELSNYLIKDKVNNTKLIVINYFKKNNNLLIPKEFSFFNTEDSKSYAIVVNSKLYIAIYKESNEKVISRITRKIEPLIINSLYLKEYDSKSICKLDLLRLAEISKIENINILLNEIDSANKEYTKLESEPSKES